MGMALALGTMSVDFAFEVKPSLGAQEARAGAVARAAVAIAASLRNFLLSDMVSVLNILTILSCKTAKLSHFTADKKVILPYDDGFILNL